MIRVLIADDFEPMRRVLGRFLRHTNNIELLEVCGNSSEVVEFLRTNQPPDVLVIEERLLTYTVATCLQEYSSVRVIVISIHFDIALIESVEGIGVRSFVLKNDLADHLVSAIRAVHRGELYLGLGDAAG